MKYKLGDKVKVKTNDKIGKIIIIDEYDTDVPYLIKFYNNYKGWYYEHELELISEKITNKNELKDGDIVTLRNGDKLIYYDKEFIDLKCENDNILEYLNDLDEKMYYICCDRKTYDIIKVERPSEYNTIFEREEIKEMTKEEIEKELGYKIKIIKEEK